MKKLAPAALVLILAACGTPAAAPEPPSETPAAPRKIFDIKFDNFQKDLEADPPVKGTAWITITKHDLVAGEVKINYIHTEGDQIGWRVNEKGELTSKHKVTSARTGRTVEVDFNSGAVLQRVEINKAVPYKYKFCKLMPKGAGVTPCEGVEIIEAYCLVNQVTYLDSGGLLQTVQKPIGLGPEPDKLCTLHGGSLRYDNMTETEAKAFRSWYAGDLLRQADDLWKSKNPKVRMKAQETYRKLMGEFPTEGLVEKNRERIKTRSEAEIED